MQRRRILVVGTTKECVFQIRSQLDGYPVELEIALGEEVARTVLRERVMHGIILDAAVAASEPVELLEFLLDRGLDIPVIFVGEGAEAAAAGVPPDIVAVAVPKPYAAEDLVAALRRTERGPAPVQNP
ncbi:MAG: hypothetical protein JXP34_10030 [Planctomycetes bacterium]|nr:hypothetical protein [Planctomycetota bacterium]